MCSLALMSITWNEKRKETWRERNSCVTCTFPWNLDWFIWQSVTVAVSLPASQWLHRLLFSFLLFYRPIDDLFTFGRARCVSPLSLSATDSNRNDDGLYPLLNDTRVCLSLVAIPVARQHTWQGGLVCVSLSVDIYIYSDRVYRILHSLLLAISFFSSSLLLGCLSRPRSSLSRPRIRLV